MNGDDVRATALEVLAGIAPETAGAELADDVPLRDQVDLDSMDVLNLLLGVQERLGVEVAAQDAAQCETLDGLVGAFLAAAAAAGAG